METRLGKIQAIKFGIGGYNDGCLGLSFTFGGSGWGVTDHKGFWDFNKIKHSEYCKWSEEDRKNQAVDLLKYISDLLEVAKITDITELKGMPVELMFEGNLLKSWRILEEVL